MSEWVDETFEWDPFPLNWGGVISTIRERGCPQCGSDDYHITEDENEYTTEIQCNGCGWMTTRAAKTPAGIPTIPELRQETDPDDS